MLPDYLYTKILAIRKLADVFHFFFLRNYGKRQVAKMKTDSINLSFIVLKSFLFLPNQRLYSNDLANESWTFIKTFWQHRIVSRMTFNDSAHIEMQRCSFAKRWLRKCFSTFLLLSSNYLLSTMQSETLKVKNRV